MSERMNWMDWIVTGVMVLAGVICFCIGTTYGGWRMKRWQDDWYQRNPVVKEVPAKETSVKDDGTLIIYGDNLPGSCEQKNGYMECKYRMTFRPAPIAPKPQKGSRVLAPSECGFVLDGKLHEIWDCKTGKDRAQKGSKRPARGELTWDGPAQMHIYYKGQSFTIPEALKKGLIEIDPAQPEKELAPEFDSNAPAPQTAEKP